MLRTAEPIEDRPCVHLRADRSRFLKRLFAVTVLPLFRMAAAVIAVWSGRSSGAALPMRRSVVFVSVLGRRCLLAAAAAALGLTAASAQARPPHIVLFIADDLGWRDIAPYGNRDVRTPNLERLAREGLRFEQAFAASPTCAPSRSSLLTGLYPMRNGAHANHSIIYDGLKTMPTVMQSLGYRTVIAGKTHFGPRESFPFEYLAGSNVSPPGKPQVLYTDLGTAAIDRLLATHDKDRPLFLVVAAHSPHVYWPDNRGYDASSLHLTPDLVDTPETRAALTRYYTDVTQVDSEVGAVRASLAKHGFRDTLFLFTSDQGAQFPSGKWSLYDAGIRVPLIASWPGHIEGGEVSPAMVSLVGLMPTLIEVAGGDAPAGLDGRSFLPALTGRDAHHLDFVYAAHTGDGKMNRAPMRMIRTERYKLIVNLRPDIRYHTHIDAGNSKDGKGLWNSWVAAARHDPKAAALVRRYHVKVAEEFYDLAEDPFELTNRADDPAVERIKADLRSRLDAWRIAQGERLDSAPMPEDARRGELKYRE